jgi:hypothetical protein
MRIEEEEMYVKMERGEGREGEGRKGDSVSVLMTKKEKKTVFKEMRHAPLEQL